MKIIKHIPNTITLCNIFCGCLSIIMTFNGNLLWAGILIFIAAICDFLDGLAARLLNAKSPIGLQLDSLCDVVSFGVAPAMIAFQLMKTSPDLLFPQMPYIALAMPVFSALRLAIFNIDNRQTENFIGMPTPINGMFWASLPCVQYFWQGFQIHPLFIALLCLVLAWLLVSSVPMFSIKFKNLSWKDNKIRFVYLFTCVIMYMLLGIIAVPVVMLLYPIFSVVVWIFDKKDIQNQIIE